MALDGVLESLYRKRSGMVKPGLSRIQAALAALESEGASLLATPTVLVGGTNGKGTTAAMLWQLLAGAGWRVGLFTSPHLVRFSERIQIYPGSLAEAELVDGLHWLQTQLPTEHFEALSFFEVTTLLALTLFSRANTQLNVLEVGLGGRWDSTNVTNPIASVITSIGMDHEEYLGPTLAHIAREKAGIMRCGRPVFWAGEPGVDPEVHEVIGEQARRQGAHLLIRGYHFGLMQSGSQEVTALTLGGRRRVQQALPHYLRGRPNFMKQNYAAAWAVFCWLQSLSTGGGCGPGHWNRQDPPATPLEEGEQGRCGEPSSPAAEKLLLGPLIACRDGKSGAARSLHPDVVDTKEDGSHPGPIGVKESPLDKPSRPWSAGFEPLSSTADGPSRTGLERGAAADVARPWASCLSGRFEWRLVGDRPVLFDVCHNVQGARCFVDAFNDLGWASPLPLGLIAILGDKDVNGILDLLKPALGAVSLFPGGSERRWSRQQLAGRHQDLPWYGSFTQAWQDLERCHPPATPVVICGSVHGIGEVFSALAIDPTSPPPLAGLPPVRC